MSNLKSNKIIPVFFATDDNYVPYLAVAVKSLLQNASKEYFYKIYVITTQLTEDNMRRLLLLKDDKSDIEFVSLKNELDKISGLFRLRDYYSKETYYRFFIPTLFPNYEKVIYLDCDMVVLADISKLYNVDLQDNYLAAVQEEVMYLNREFTEYTVKNIGVKTEKYFSAGMLVINTKKFLKDKIVEKFISLAKEYTFRLVQDQDYLNILCKDKVLYLDLGWNKTAADITSFDDKNLKIIHYKINWKPWHYQGVKYEDFFWKYAKETDFYLDILDTLRKYPEERKIIDANAVENMKKIADEDSNNPLNFKQTYYKRHKGKFIVHAIKKMQHLNSIKKYLNLKAYRSVYGSRKK